MEVCKVLAKGLMEKNILKGDVEEIVSKGVHALFMPHGLGHMVGVNVMNGKYRRSYSWL